MAALEAHGASSVALGDAAQWVLFESTWCKGRTLLLDGVVADDDEEATLFETVIDAMGRADDAASSSYFDGIAGRCAPNGTVVVCSRRRGGPAANGAPALVDAAAARGWRCVGCALVHGVDVVRYSRKGDDSIVPRPFDDDPDSEDDGLPKWIEGDSLAPFVGTPTEHLSAVFAFAGVGPGDVVVDVGSGDGRIPIWAVTEAGAARSVGIELEADLVVKARAHALARGVAHRCAFVHGDCLDSGQMRDALLSEATLMTMYLLPEALVQVRPIIDAHLRRPKTRLLTIGWAPGDLRPVAKATCGASAACCLDAYLYDASSLTADPTIPVKDLSLS